MLRAVIVIDYQNIHLTARGKFTAPGTPTHESLVHPLRFAEQLLIARANAKGADAPAVKVAKVHTFRGLPSNRHDPTSYRRSQAQQAEWTRDPRVEVTYRPLRYQEINGVLTPQEKGVDVLVALKFTELVAAAQYDVAILAAHDTDLEPALEVALRSDAARSRKVTVETAGWYQCKRIAPRNGDRKPWHTFLAVNHFTNARDLKDYT
ncbi:NYN domain-containing protein [Nocardia sp. AG03]|uniref:NYN domain-containing protein n=1 Tax=Nocardia sp. AG03 TaxID=3025312 RepID=UPI00241859BA|nr:NYN domain-containing protein [Nocardia sp. AG03]